MWLSLSTKVEAQHRHSTTGTMVRLVIGVSKSPSGPLLTDVICLPALCVWDAAFYLYDINCKVISLIIYWLPKIYSSHGTPCQTTCKSDDATCFQAPPPSVFHSFPFYHLNRQSFHSVKTIQDRGIDECSSMGLKHLDLASTYFFSCGKMTLIYTFLRSVLCQECVSWFHSA